VSLTVTLDWKRNRATELQIKTYIYNHHSVETNIYS